MESTLPECGTLEVRLASETDALQICLLYKRVWDEYRDRFPEQLIESRQPSQEKMVQWMHDCTYFVAEKHGKVIGVVGACMEHGTCKLTHMVVEKTYRHKGVGSALVRAVLGHAQRQDARKVWLDTVPLLKEAVSLYEKFGFQKRGTLEKHFWGMDVELYELLIY